MKRAVGLVERAEDAQTVVGALTRAGFAPESVVVLHPVHALWQAIDCVPRKKLLSAFTMGALIGVAIYLLFGVLVTAGQAATGVRLGPGIVWSIFLGGGLGLVTSIGGVMEKENRAHARNLRRGGALVVVQTADEHASQALSVLRQTRVQNAVICAAPRRAMPSPPTYTRASRRIRVIARGLTAALLLLMLALMVDEGLPLPAFLTLSEHLLMLACTVTLLGLLVAWRF